jgi:hypothetical protein
MVHGTESVFNPGIFNGPPAVEPTGGGVAVALEAAGCVIGGVGVGTGLIDVISELAPSLGRDASLSLNPSESWADIGIATVKDRDATIANCAILRKILTPIPLYRRGGIADCRCFLPCHPIG